MSSVLSAATPAAMSPAGWVATLSFVLIILATAVLLFAAARARRRRPGTDEHRGRA